MTVLTGSVAASSRYSGWQRNGYDEVAPGNHVRLIAASSAIRISFAWLGLVVVIAQVSAATMYSELEGKSISIDQNWTKSRDMKMQFNWTTDATSMSISYGVSIQNGTVSLLIMDGSDSVIFEKTITGSIEGSIDRPSVKAGPWKIVADYSHFVGRLEVTLTPTVAIAETVTSAATTGSTGHTTMSGSGSARAAASLAPLAIWAGLALAAAAARGVSARGRTTSRQGGRPPE